MLYSSSPELIEKQREWSNIESNITEWMLGNALHFIYLDILKSKVKEVDVNLCIMYTLYSGIKTSNCDTSFILDLKSEEYTFLWDFIRKNPL